MSLQAITDRLGPPHMELSYEDLERFRGPIVYVWTREAETMPQSILARADHVIE